MKHSAANAFAGPGLIGARRLSAALLGLVALLTLCGAQAHEGAATAFASITVKDSRVLYSLTTSSQPWAQADSAADTTLEAQVDARAAESADARADAVRMSALIARHLRIEADGRPCAAGAADFVPPSPPRLSTTYNIEYRCNSPIGRLHVADDSFDVIGRGTHTLLRVNVEGREEPVSPVVLLGDETRSAVFDLGTPARTGAERAPRGAVGFLPLGIQHILEGWDHLLFLLALVLPGGSLGNLIRIVTAFTVAHSLTLAAAVLAWVSVPPAPVEALIALSIAWVAAENLARGQPMSRRWIVAFAFGLIHGFGFSNVLRGIGLSTDALLSSLMWFNLGIELGQLLVVLLLVPTLAWVGRQPLGRPVPQVLSALILVASLVLLVHRF